MTRLREIIPPFDDRTMKLLSWTTSDNFTFAEDTNLCVRDVLDHILHALRGVEGVPTNPDGHPGSWLCTESGTNGWRRAAWDSDLVADTLAKTFTPFSISLGGCSFLALQIRCAESGCVKSVDLGITRLRMFEMASWTEFINAAGIDAHGPFETHGVACVLTSNGVYSKRVVDHFELDTGRVAEFAARAHDTWLWPKRFRTFDAVRSRIANLPEICSHERSPELTKPMRVIDMDIWEEI